MPDSGSDRLEEFRTAVRRVPATAERLAEFGWPLPTMLTFRELDAVLELDPSEIDQYFVELFDADDRQRFRDLCKRLIFDRSTLRPWQLLLAECADSYLADMHRLTVPALLTVLEGSIVGGPGRTGRWKEALGAIADRPLGDNLGGDIDLALLKANHRFFEQIFAPAAFDSRRPTVLNRHWILHGRDVASWTRADSLRLFFAVDTCSQLVERTSV